MRGGFEYIMEMNEFLKRDGEKLFSNRLFPEKFYKSWKNCRIEHHVSVLGWGSFEPVHITFCLSSNISLILCPNIFFLLYMVYHFCETNITAMPERAWSDASLPYPGGKRWEAIMERDPVAILPRMRRHAPGLIMCTWSFLQISCDKRNVSKIFMESFLFQRGILLSK